MARSYNNMYKSDVEKEVTPNEEVVEVVEVEEPVEKIKPEKPAKREKKNAIPESGKVIGDASLNVRQNPSLSAGIINTLTPGVVVNIVEQSDEWYKISAPVAGFVMKKFVEV